MPKGHRTPDAKREQVIALAQTSTTQQAIADTVRISRRQVGRILKEAGIGRGAKEAEQTRKRLGEGYPSDIAKEFGRDPRTAKVDLRAPSRAGPETPEPEPPKATLFIGPAEWQIRHYVEGSLRNVAHVVVRNTGPETAEVCRGFFILQATGNGLEQDFKLHWASTDCTLEDDSAEPVDIPPGTTRRLDLVFSIGAIRSSFQTSRALPPASQLHHSPRNPYPEMGPGTASATLPPQGPSGVPMRGAGTREHTIVTADRLALRMTDGKGCWIAIPLALSRPDMAGQAYLPPGEYAIQVRVLCENGQGDVKAFRLKSPEGWQALALEEVVR